MFWNFCVEWRHDVNVCTVRSMTSHNLISHVYNIIRKFVMVILHGKQGLFCDKIGVISLVVEVVVVGVTAASIEQQY